jgi:CobQ-like glutamine amidotransferase family enzyme
MNCELTIGWLYPDLMSTYGDRGNVIVLQKRAEWREIKTTVLSLSVGSSAKELKQCDLIFMGGAQDRQQQIVADDFRTGKAQALSEMIEEGVPGLYICGAYQFLGKYYKEADGTIIECLGILDLYTENPGHDHDRLIGNIAFQPRFLDGVQTIVGFENHGGRTYLGDKVAPLGKVLKGFGNNGKDSFEGAIYKNTLGSYLHGPILPKNPELADYFIQKALEKKYGGIMTLTPLDDTLEHEAHQLIVRRLDVGV